MKKTAKRMEEKSTRNTDKKEDVKLVKKMVKKNCQK